MTTYHDDGRVVAVVAVLGESLAHLHLDELQHLRVVDNVRLVDKHDQVVNADLGRNVAGSLMESNKH
jgi:hypothetical protein